MLYVILEKAKPYTRTRKGKLEHVKGTFVYPGGYRFAGIDEWYERHKEEIWGKKRRKGFVPTSFRESKKYKAYFDKAWPGYGKPGYEMTGVPSASFSSDMQVSRENWPPQPLLNYGKQKLRKKKKGQSYTEEVPLQGGGSGWVMS